jgi:heat shock protein HtpX
VAKLAPWILLVATAGFFTGGGWMWLGTAGAIIGAGLAVFASILFGALSYLATDISASYGARAPFSPDEIAAAAAAGMARDANIHPPEILIADIDDANALVTAYAYDSCRIVLTKGLLRALSPEELRAVLAHQIACMKRGDTLLQLSITVLLMFIGGAGYFALPKRSSIYPRPGLFIQVLAGLVLLTVAVVIWLLRCAVQYVRQFGIDSMACACAAMPRLTFAR